MKYETKGRRAKGRPRSGKMWLIWAGALGLTLVIAGVGLFTAGLLGDSGSEYATTELAPDVALVTATNDFRLVEHRGEVVILYFSFPG